MTDDVRRKLNWFADQLKKRQDPVSVHRRAARQRARIRKLASEGLIPPKPTKTELRAAASFNGGITPEGSDPVQFDIDNPLNDDIPF